MTITLTIGNSMSKVEGITPLLLERLRKLMSYTLDPRQAHFGGFRAQGPRYLMSKRGEFPTGLLYLFEEYCHKNRVVFVTKDMRLPPSLPPGRPTILPIGPAPYPEQRGAVLAAVDNHRGIIVAPTGLGKSVIAGLICQAINVPTLIVVPTLELKTQLTASLAYWFGAGSNITVQNVDALDPKVPAMVDMVIVDEFHHSGAKTYRELNKRAWAGVYYKFGMTATPFRSQDHERLLLESVLSKVIYRVEYKDAVAQGRIVPMEAYYIELPTQKVKGDTWPAVYSELVVNNVWRNELICRLLDQLTCRPTLCLVKEIQHGNNIQHQVSDKPAFANGQDFRTRQYILEFNLKERFALLGTTGVLGEGVDTKPAEYIIIAGLGKSKNQFMQQVGRGFRTYPGKESCKIIIFKDPSHKWTLAHYAAQVKILKDEYGIKPTKLDITGFV